MKAAKISHTVALEKPDRAKASAASARVEAGPRELFRTVENEGVEHGHER